MEKKKHIVSISSGFIWRVLLVALGVIFFYYIRDILILLFMSLIIVSAAAPLVDGLQKKRIPRPVSVVALLVLFIMIITFLAYITVPIVTVEAKQFGSQLPQYIDGVNKFFNQLTKISSSYKINIDQQKVSENISNQLALSISDIFTNTLAFFGNIFHIFVVLSLSIYMLAKKDAIKSFLSAIIPSQHRLYAIHLADRIQYKMGRWLIGQIALIVIIFILDYSALTLLDVPYALIIALFGALLEIIPYIGPTIALIPAVLAGLTISPLVALVVLVLYVFFQQLEGHVFTPLVMKKAVGLNPVAVILALLIGAKLAGVVGVLISVPAATAIAELLKDLTSFKKEEEAAIT